MNTATEIEQLSETLNHMLEQMEKALNTEKTARTRMARFIADASHELRTPLTSIRGFLEILAKNGNKDPETLDAAHQTMLMETERLIRLTEDLLALNRFSQEEQGKELPAEYCADLQETLAELLPFFLPSLENKILWLNNVAIKKPEDLPLPGPDRVPALPLKPDELKQVLFNLIHNAIQYTSSQGTIDIQIRANEDWLTLSVIDNGKGIPPQDLPHVFERFFRGDRSRSQNAAQGSGLGLAIVAQIVRVRNGKITVNSTLGQGATFTITFPLC